MTTRRKFIVLAGGAAVWPLAARAQQVDHMRRVGVLLAFAETDPESKARLAALQQGLEKHGWSEGRNIRIDARFAAGRADQHQTLAKELVGGAKGGDQGECGLAKHALDTAPGSRVTGAGTHAAIVCRLDPRWEPYAGKPHVRFWAGGA
jgi:hypothetical protein